MACYMKYCLQINMADSECLLNPQSRETINKNPLKTDYSSSCSSCGSPDFKYRCPRCNILSCSLACVKKHKILHSCSGQRDKTKYVAKCEYNEENLLNDYRFLEEANRVSDNARRDQKNKQKFFSKNVKKLKNEAAKKGVELRLVPVGFQKRTENTSFFHFKTKVILWRIRWEFPQAIAHYVEARVSENKSIQTLLEKYLHPTLADPVFKQRLKNYCCEEIAVFMRNHSTQMESFFRIDKSMTVAEALKGKVVIEYPIFHVVLSGHFSEYRTDLSSPSFTRNVDFSFIVSGSETTFTFPTTIQAVNRIGETITSRILEKVVKRRRLGDLDGNSDSEVHDGWDLSPENAECA